MLTFDTFNLYLFVFVVYISILFGVFWIFLYLKHRRFVYENINGKEIPLTMIIPAHNEEKHLKKCVESIKEQNYEERVDILIVDDGSTDNTGSIADELARKHKNVRVIHQKNMGKAHALNRALKEVHTSVVGFIDADSFLSKNVLSTSVKYLSKYDSVVSPMLPTKTNKIILRLQEIEYMMASMTRKISSAIGAMFLTPGMAIYKTDVLRNVKGFSTTTITEDLEMGLKLILNGYKIGYISNEFVYTECPETWKRFLRQRIRWTRGFIENMIHYRKLLFNRKHEHLGLFVLPMRVIIPLSAVTLYVLSAYDSIISFVQNIIDFVNTNFDIGFFVSTRHISISTYSTVFFLILTFSYLIIIHMARKYSRRNVRPLDLVTFILIYPTINMLITIISIAYEIVGAKKRW